jgi:hypothetical protein
MSRATPSPADKDGSGIFRNIPRGLMKEVKIAATVVEGKSINALLIEA